MIPPHGGGLPHSEIRGSTVAHASARLIAVCHVLHRLSMPRHPPDALRSLARSSTKPTVPAKGRSVAAKAIEHTFGRHLRSPPTPTTDDVRRRRWTRSQATPASCRELSSRCQNQRHRPKPADHAPFPTIEPRHRRRRTPEIRRSCPRSSTCDHSPTPQPPSHLDPPRCGTPHRANDAAAGQGMVGLG